ncbi:hypothetical protein OIU85_010151 [Salix viminalis]|uniref:Uncharacterized protein n=1 Tax=Salix viminalis TaxID=40686 RepID=A0A9Q0NVZ4_SALVM|nr:hypothetical protein OIU85_010151 [Salix viminalis]
MESLDILSISRAMFYGKCCSIAAFPLRFVALAIVIWNDSLPPLFSFSFVFLQESLSPGGGQYCTDISCLLLGERERLPSVATPSLSQQRRSLPSAQPKPAATK